MPFSEVDELVCNPVDSVLIEYLVDGASKSFGISVGAFLVVIEEDASVFVFTVQWLEILCVVRQEDSARLTTPLDKFSVRCVFTKPVFRLFYVVSTLSE